MDNILNKTITITSIEDKPKLLVIKDEAGDKFKVWKAKQDGFPTIAFGSFKFQVGSQTKISYKEEPANFTNKEGKTINYTDRTAIKFEPPQDDLSDTSNAPEISVDGNRRSNFNNNKSQCGTNKGQIKPISHDDEVFGQCKFGFMRDLLKTETNYDELEKKAEDLATRAMRKLSETTDQAIDEGEPLPNIPF